MMLGEESTSATYWKQCGDEALAHGVKGIVMMGGKSWLLLKSLCETILPRFLWFHSSILRLLYSSLGQSRRQDRGRHASKAEQVTRRLCSSSKV